MTNSSRIEIEDGAERLSTGTVIADETVPIEQGNSNRSDDGVSYCIRTGSEWLRLAPNGSDWLGLARIGSNRFAPRGVALFDNRAIRLVSE